MKTIPMPSQLRPADNPELEKAIRDLKDGDVLQLETAFELYSARKMSPHSFNEFTIRTYGDMILLIKLPSVSKCERCEKEESAWQNWPKDWSGWGISKYGRKYSKTGRAMYCPECRDLWKIPYIKVAVQ